jgi:NADH:ubiquinone oxidoreductase subunit K
MKIIVFVGLAAVITALVLAGVFLNRDRGRGNRVMITLGIRVLLSASLVAFLVISYWLGWIGPSGLR